MPTSDARALAAPLAALALGGCAGAPDILRAAGEPAGSQAALGSWTTGIALLVVVAMAALLVAALRRGRRGPGPEPGSPVSADPPGGLRWIYAGTGASVLVLLGVMLATAAGLARGGPGPEAVVVEVTGKRWWWEVRYPGDRVEDGFVTANEIHVPVGRPVRLRLTSADVIHSFWVPQLGGKTDMIPGTVNESWFRADRPGVYRGQCGEYCGRQHARMALVVVAQAPAEFAAWQERQRSAAAAPPPGEARVGRRVFEQRCAACHTVRGTRALGEAGPDLTHLAGRRTLAGGTLPNTPAALRRWIRDPQGAKPGTLMPDVPLRDDELRATVAYLQHLR
ncbi:MAG TPA: cytochrome c oxidase subunit II [Longimicrobiaceae bacterium]|jgi:cytochrome c oxidase subunit 2